MNLVDPKDVPPENIVPGVMQLENGQLFQHARRGGQDVMVEYIDRRDFFLTKGTFTKDSIHVMVNDRGKVRRCGSKEK